VAPETASKKKHNKGNLGKLAGTRGNGRAVSRELPILSVCVNKRTGKKKNFDVE